MNENAAHLSSADALAFTSLGSLGRCVDRKLICILRDGRKFIGILRAFDQFANLVLQNTVERIYADSVYSDIDRDIFIIRGENVVLLGELDLEKDSNSAAQKVPIEEAIRRQGEVLKAKKIKDKKRYKTLRELGFIAEAAEDDLY